MIRALLIGKEPDRPLPYTYVREAPYEAVVIGSLSLSQALGLRVERVLQALAEGKQVVLYTPGLPGGGGNRALCASLAAARREMKSWGIVFTDGGQRMLITAREARLLRAAGRQPGPGAVLTPLAKEILGGAYEDRNSDRGGLVLPEGGLPYGADIFGGEYSGR